MCCSSPGEGLHQVGCDGDLVVGCAVGPTSGGRDKETVLRTEDKLLEGPEVTSG